MFLKSKNQTTATLDPNFLQLITPLVNSLKLKGENFTVFLPGPFIDNKGEMKR